MTREIVIRAESGGVVARMNVEEGVLNGPCQWYDSKGNLVAYGFFKAGRPFTGTFLNWPKFFGERNEATFYDPETYCKDWISDFESTFDSEPPMYQMVVEAYCKGQKI